MEAQLQNHAIGIPVISSTCIMSRQDSHTQSQHLHCLENVPNRFRQRKSLATVTGREESVLKRMNKPGRKTDLFAIANSVREHVRLSPKITAAVKGKLSLGARILQGGGMGKVFKLLFGVCEKERLIKASQCYLSTTTGPIAGLLFISTKKVAFCSERSIKFSCPNGETIRILYKVAIPLTRIEKANQSENIRRPSQKYVQIVTIDGFDFWFMGFLNYEKSFNCLQRVISQELDG